jgi:phosphatidylserine decarboxylase
VSAEHGAEQRPLSERLAVAAQHLLPQQALTRFAGLVAGAQLGALTTLNIRWFIGRYGVNMAEAANADPGAYASFNEFFTRELKPGVRPLAQADLVCPVDGAISQFGAIDGDQIFQAKGHSYSITALVGGDGALAAHFHAGHFATLYLSPRDYHRIHMPCAGRLLRMIHVPGALFSVNPATARGVPGLFARNERVVCVFEGAAGRLLRMTHVPGELFSVNPATARGVPGLFARNERVVCVFDGLSDETGRDRGPWALVLVGATIVGSMATRWHGVVNPPRPGTVRDWRYNDQDIRLAQGAEMGRFLLGSTVVMLFPPGPLRFNPDWKPGGAVRLGQAMAQRG